MTPEAVEALSGIFKTCQGSALILEIGAADGTDTLDMFTLAKSFGHTPSIHAFEPDPRNSVLYRKRLWMVRTDFNTCAVSDHDGTQPMWFSDGKHPNHSDGWSFSNTLKQPTGHYKRYPWVTFNDPKSTLVDTITLDTYYKKWLAQHVVDMIWADVNGAEREMIAGARGTLQRTRYLLTEFARGQQLFEGQVTMWDLARLLPDWEPEVIFENDILLKNINYQPGGRFFGIQSFDDYSAAWDGDSR